MTALRFTARALVLIAALLGLRLILAATLPLADTTEARYAEIARLMAVTGDWITPWFEPGVPFWGKPPASFWTQAISFKLFDVTAFAGRLPSWIATVATTALIARTRPGTTGVMASLIYITMALPFVCAGTVMTDTFLALGTTLSLTAILIRLENGATHWGWLFFIGLAIGLLSKGPLTLVLVGFPVGVWLLISGDWRRLWRALPWVGGTVLVSVLVVPWYVLAEIKTPGFLDYFLIGEHFKRFLVSEWAGDLYGSAHDYPRGTIWLHWLMASFPWGIFALFVMLGRWLSGSRPFPHQNTPDPYRLNGLILTAALTPLIFFTLAGNILWTYVLPGLPFAALLIARLVMPMMHRGHLKPVLALILLLTPLIAGAAGGWFSLNPEALKTEGPLLARVNAEVTYIDHRPYSARFYSSGSADLMERGELLQRMQSDPAALPEKLAIKRGDQTLAESISGHYREIDSNLRYRLFTR